MAPAPCPCSPGRNRPPAEDTPAPGPRRRQMLLAVLGATVVAAHAAPSGQKLHARQRHLFGSSADLLATGPDTAAAKRVLDSTMALLQTIHQRWNAWKPGELSALNQALRDGRPVAVSPALAALVRQSARLEQSSLGFFNPAIGRAVAGWGFHEDVLRPGRRPADATVARWRADRPSLRQLHARGNTFHGAAPGLQLDFGAYAKGVAIDMALDHLARHGVQNAVVNLGGNLAAMGRPGERAWRIGIRDPDDPAALVATLTTEGREAVVTSGSYERTRLVDGEPVTHILNPFTAAPVLELVSVTVVHRDAGLADAAATALLAAGPQAWRAVARSMGVADVLIVDWHRRAIVTGQLSERLEFASEAWRQRTTRL